MRGLLAAISTLTTGGLGVAINFATGSTSNLLAWAAVVLLAAVSGVISFFLVDNSGSTPGNSLTVAGDVRNEHGYVHVGDNNQFHGVSGRQLSMIVAVVVVSVVVIGVVSVVSRPDAAAEARAAAAVGEPPLITADIADGNCGNAGFIAQMPPEEVAAMPAKPDDVGWTEWPPTAEAVAAGEELVTLSVQGSGSAQVTLTDIRIRVVDRTPPLTGTALAGACGEEGAYRLLRADLDQDPPRMVAATNGDTNPAPGTPSWATTPARFPYRVSMSDTETFAIYANATQFDVRWVIDVDWSSGDRSDTITVDDHGRPFRTSGTVAATSCDYAFGELIC